MPDEQPLTSLSTSSQRRARRHDEDGLDLARLITRSLAQAAGRAPRRRGRPGRQDSPADRRRGGLSGARPDDRDPQLVGPTLDKLVSDRGWEVDLKVQAVFGRWAELVGAEVAAHTAPEAVRRRQARRAHRLHRLGGPAAPARAHRRTPSQRGARPRHGHAHRRRWARTGRRGRRAGSARATVVDPATPTAEQPPGLTTPISRFQAVATVGRCRSPRLSGDPDNQSPDARICRSAGLAVV